MSELNAPTSNDSSISAEPRRWVWKTWHECLLLFAVPFLLYAPSYSYGLLGLDDTTYYKVNRTLQGGLREGLAGIWNPFYSEFFPVTQFTYWLDLALFGSENWWGARVHELAWFGLGVLGVRALLLRMGAGRGIAFAVALIYAVHPVCASSVLWLANRKTVVAFALSIWCIERYVCARQEEQPRGRYRAYGAALIFALLALLSKPHAVALPGMLLAYELTLGAGRMPRRAVYWAPFAVLTAAFLALSFLGTGRNDLDFPYLGGSRAAAFVSSGPVLLRYAFHTVAPKKLSFFYSVPELPVDSGAGWIAWLQVALVAMAVILMASRRRLAAGGILMGLAALAPAINLMPQPIPMSDHYLQWALPGWLLGLALLVERLLEKISASYRLRLGAILGVGAVFACAIFTSLRIPTFAAGVTLLEDATRKQPASALAWSNYALFLFKTHDPALHDEAVEACAIALACNGQRRLPPATRARMIRETAVALHRTGNAELAQKVVRKELESETDGSIPFYRVAHAEICVLTGRPKEALELLAQDFTPAHEQAAAAIRKLCRQGAELPHRIPPQIQIGWLQGDDYDQSEASAVIFRGMGIMARAWELTGDLERAFDVAALQVHMAPKDEIARKNLAEIYRKLGLPEAAEAIGK